MLTYAEAYLCYANLHTTFLSRPVHTPYTNVYVVAVSLYPFSDLTQLCPAYRLAYILVHLPQNLIFYLTLHPYL